ncbi:MAG: arginine--tRNA ligase [Caldisericia bacterium]
MINCSVKNFILEIVLKSLEKLGVSDHKFDILKPDTPDHGDFSSNVAMTLAKKLKKSPRAIAQEIIDNIDPNSFDKIEIAGPGFINFFLSGDVLINFVKHANSDDFGKWDAGKGKRIQVEFVSANPTGPVTVANGRGAPLGDTIATLLQWVGYDVEREFYVNDRGAKIGHLADSLEARYKQALGLPWQLTEEGYPGEYLLDIAKDIVTEKGNSLLDLGDEERHQFFRIEAVKGIVSWQRDVFQNSVLILMFGFLKRRWSTLVK